MNLSRTQQLIHDGIDPNAPVESLIHVLESAIELLSLPDNDFCWSSWQGEQDAVAELNSIINLLKESSLPERVKVAVLFAPTGPLQEVSLSSGWGDAFLKVAEKYDEIEKRLW
ncbi:hypothetical protein D3870_17140 [Noviherbaspirillum cavernae]|uniref:Uncharacterized protein n=1 Tax=Noviherbaspirillum cavernae TaxID=2320862 RepID=A0A418X4Z4_9BURK|nr:hypothetical protein [Noviherbaspirillum cavernae]RJG07489.1 hypothetical protein D3870_17140 [Noviherbaspirillum cavernae]